MKINTLMNGECWIWTRGKNCHGYGKFSLRGEDVYAHRFSYAVFRGRINECYDIHHKTICKNKLCCNPWHLKKIKHDEHTINHNNTDDIPF